ncbi:MAG: helix-turn-helix transcriptional regulator [Armatimonadota bacterium]
MMKQQTKTEQLLSTLAQRMRDRRKTLGITQEQLAERSDLSTNYIAKLELGKRVPSFGTLISLAEALDVEVYELLTVSTERPWAGAAQEVERVMALLNEQDSQFLLGEFQNIAHYIRSLRKEQS